MGACVAVEPAADDREAEDAQIAWIVRTNATIVEAISEMWLEWTPARASQVIHLTGAPKVATLLPL